jgi:thioredoxin-like negative regulator of GroEL
MSETESSKRLQRQIGSIIAVFIVLAFVGIVIVKEGSAAAVAPGEGSATATSTPAGKPSESLADAAAAYEAARAGGKPIYVLFHSLTCIPCVEISAVIDRVVPDYEGRVVFVNAITTEAAAQRLAERFPFQYIPTSFFVDSRGELVDSFTGALEEPAMRAYLDRLTQR